MIDLLPIEAGSNVIVMVSDPPGAIVAEVGETSNSETSVPSRVIPVTDRSETPGFVIVIVP